MIESRKSAMDVIAWWGYIHENDTLHTKRYYGPQDIQEAKESPFCKYVHGPFPARNSEIAMEELKKHELVRQLRLRTGTGIENSWKLLIKNDFNIEKAIEDHSINGKKF